MDTWFYDRDAQFLASRGYAVLQVNFRGSGGRGIAFQKSGYRQWGSGIQDDLIDGVRWATTKGIADPDRACIFGASFGGYSALMAVIREPDLFKCAVGYAGVYDLPSILTEYKTRRNKRRFNYFTESLGDDTQKLESYSPASQAEKIKVPIFLAHGKEDDIALPSQAELMRNALDKAGKPYEWMMVPQEGHGFYAAKNRIAFYEKLEAFLAKYIGPK
jgi:dipeptidyl aminopeptidase/acylaminoacyl peptidase